MQAELLLPLYLNYTAVLLCKLHMLCSVVCLQANWLQQLHLHCYFDYHPTKISCT